MGYCVQYGCPCSNANSDGYCNLTVCCKQNPLSHYVYTTSTTTTVTSTGVVSMCDNCKHRWVKKCDIDEDPSKCDKWEPD